MGRLTARTRAAVWGAGLLAAGAVAGGVVSQLGVASADTTPGAGTAVHQPGRGPLGMFGQLGKPLYGDVTVQKPDGSTAVEHFQVGKAAVSGSTLTVTTGTVTTTYTTDSGTDVRKDGETVALSAVDGDTVVVVAENGVARLVHDGRGGPFGGPGRHAGAEMASGTAAVQDGKLVVDGTTFTVDSSTRIVKNGAAATLAQVAGDTVRVFGTRNADGTYTARLVVDGPGMPGMGGGRHGGGFGGMPGPWGGSGTSA